MFSQFGVHVLMQIPRDYDTQQQQRYMLLLAAYLSTLSLTLIAEFEKNIICTKRKIVII